MSPAFPFSASCIVRFKCTVSPEIPIGPVQWPEIWYATLNRLGARLEVNAARIIQLGGELHSCNVGFCRFAIIRAGFRWRDCDAIRTGMVVISFSGFAVTVSLAVLSVDTMWCAGVLQVSVVPRSVVR